MNREEFFKIVNEFKNEFLFTENGKRAFNAYEKERKIVKNYFKEILERKAKGEDFSDLFEYLFPIKRRESMFPLGFRSLDAFYTRREDKTLDLKKLSIYLIEMVQELIENPDNPEKQKEIINKFVSSGYELGIQTGFVSPILFYLEPKYYPINSKTVDTVRFVSREYLKKEVRISNRLEKYIDNLNKLKEFLGIISKDIPEFKNIEVFDAFCHWMCEKELGGYARGYKIIINTENISNIRDPNALKNAYLNNRTNLSIVLDIIGNKYCPPDIKNDFILYALEKHLKEYLTDDSKLNDIIAIIRKHLSSNVTTASFKIPDIEEIKDDKKAKRIFDLLKHHKQVILYGPPGTSKTYYAKLVANAIAGSLNNIKFVQFHPSYSYEDFVEGIFPETTGNGSQVNFKIQDKIFKTICMEANENPTQNYVLIIDEINRADLSKVFGEIFSALEYRNEAVVLLYSRESLRIPENLYIIGTMNTLDKSTVDIDFALMRRFKFIEVAPDEQILRKILNIEDKELVEKVVSVFNKIQNYYPLGHAYFKNIASKRDLEFLWESQLSFLLKEYFTDLKRDEFLKIKELYRSELGLEN